MPPCIHILSRQPTVFCPLAKHCDSVTVSCHLCCQPDSLSFHPKFFKCLPPSDSLPFGADNQLLLNNRLSDPEALSPATYVADNGSAGRRSPPNKPIPVGRLRCCLAGAAFLEALLSQGLLLPHSSPSSVPSALSLATNRILI